MQFKNFKLTPMKLTGGERVTLVNVGSSDSGDEPDVNVLNRIVDSAVQA